MGMTDRKLLYICRVEDKEDEWWATTSSGAYFGMVRPGKDGGWVVELKKGPVEKPFSSFHEALSTLVNAASEQDADTE